jgi:hypothetical protein
MLAYVFWHSPSDRSGIAAYERALVSFQRSLARTPPFGFRGSAVFRIDAFPWSAAGPRDDAQGPGDRSSAGAARARVRARGPAREAYEDWYLLEDFTALGVLNEAAVGRGHRTSHDRAAKGLGEGTAGLYRLVEGELASAKPLAACTHATWVAPGAQGNRAELGALLGDGMARDGASVWQRQLVLGPAPEFCVLAREDPLGVAPTRLAAQWSARTLAREALFGA